MTHRGSILDVLPLRLLIFLGMSMLWALLPTAFITIWRPYASTRDITWGCGLGLWMEGMLSLFFLFHAALFIAHLYRISWGAALDFLLRMLLTPTSEIPIGQVKDGDLTASTKSSVLARVGGPGTLVVHESNLVLLERGGVFTRLIGPGAHRLKPFERPALVLDLRPQTRRRQVQTWTRDGIPIQTTLYLSCRLRWSPGDPEGEARLIRMAYALDFGSREQGYAIPWAGELADEARVHLARRLGQLWFDELWSPYSPEAFTEAPQPPRIVGEPSSEEGFEGPWGIPERPPENAPSPAVWERIRDEIQTDLEARAQAWNAEILNFAFDPPVPWPEAEPLVRQAWLEHWRVPWRGWAVHLQSRAVREQLRQRELARAMGQRELLEAIAAVIQEEQPLEDPRRGMQRLVLRLAELVRHWAPPEAALLTPTDLLELFHHFRRMLNLQRPGSEGGSSGPGTPPPFPTDPGVE